MPKIELIARISLACAGRCMSRYGSIKSRKDFTQPQLMACLVLKAVMKADYRSICDYLELMPRVRRAIGLKKTPHYTTLQKFMAKSDVPAIVEAIMPEVLKEAGVLDEQHDVAVDSTGMQNGVASLHYHTKRYRADGKARKTVKVSTAVICGALLPVGLVVDIGASADMKQMPKLMAQIESTMTPRRLLGDRGFDAEWVHVTCREKWKTESLIPAWSRAPDGSIKTHWRSKMQDLPKAYGRRWHAESFFSGLKRTTMATLSSRTERTLIAEATLKVLAYAIRR